MTPPRLLALLVSVLSLPSARADEPTAAQRADERFEAGRRLAAEGKDTEACRAFEESEALDPAAGTLLNLGDCYARLGRSTTAWSRYREAMERAQADHDEPRRKLAESRAGEMALKVARLTIVSSGAGLILERDGEPIPAADLGKPIPVDPGGHTVTATVPGQMPWTLRVDVPAGGSVTVEVPVSGHAFARKDEGPHREDLRPTLAIVTGVAALGLLGAGSIFGLRAADRWDESQGHCEGGLCDARGVDLADEAHTAATASTVLFTAGGVCAAGAVFLWWSSRPDGFGFALAPGGGTFTVEGRF